MKPEGSLLCSQDPATGPYPEPFESNPHLPTALFSSLLPFSPSWVHPLSNTQSVFLP
jgi:hypothetical protein